MITMIVLCKVFESFQDTVYVEKLKKTDLITSIVKVYLLFSFARLKSTSKLSILNWHSGKMNDLSENNSRH